MEPTSKTSGVEARLVLSGRREWRESCDYFLRSLDAPHIVRGETVISEDGEPYSVVVLPQTGRDERNTFFIRVLLVPETF